MRTAIRLGIAPEGFWRLSLREWRALVDATAQAASLGRGDFERMMEAWPDD